MSLDDPTWRRAVFLDTSAIFVLLTASDVSHDQAMAVFRTLTLDRRMAVTSNFVVAETHGLLLRRFGRIGGIRFLQRLRDDFATVVRVTSKDEIQAVTIIEGFVDKPFSYTDATSFAVMDRLGISTAFSFDRHFRQYGKETLGLDD